MILFGQPLIILVAAALFTFAAATIRGLTGFGMAIILVPLLGMVMAPTDAVMLAILLQLLIGPVGLPTILADGHRSSAIPIAAIAMVTTPVGLLLLGVTPPALARVLIAAIAVAAFLLVLLPPTARGAPGQIATAATGVASGILTGFAAMPGPPVIPYYLRQAMAPAQARASMMLVFFGTAIAGTVAGVAMHRIGWSTFGLAMLLFLPVLAGNWLDARAFGRVPAPLWRGIVAVILGVAAISAVVRLW